jgi:hypothetical protein
MSLHDLEGYAALITAVIILTALYRDADKFIKPKK